MACTSCADRRADLRRALSQGKPVQAARVAIQGVTEMTAQAQRALRRHLAPPVAQAFKGKRK